MITRLTFVLRRRWPILAALIVAGAVCGVLLGSPATSSGPRYEAEAVVAADQMATNPTQVQQDLVQAERGGVAADVARVLGGTATPQTVARGIDAEFDKESFVAEISATASTPAAAERLAETFASAFIADGNGGTTASLDDAVAAAEVDRDAAQAELQAFLAANADALRSTAPDPVLLAQRDELEATLATFTATIANIRSNAPSADAYELVSVGSASEVAPSKLVVLDSTVARALLGVLLGLAAAALVIAVAERTNPRIDGASQAAEVVGAPVIAMVPLLRRRQRTGLERVDPETFTGPYAEGIRTLRAHLDFRAAAEERDKPPRIMVTSATPQEGKTTTAAFLALSFAESEQRPVVIGGDLRRPSIHRLFGIERIPGLASRAQPGGSSIALPSLVRTDPVSRVILMPSGPSVHQVDDIVADVVTTANAAQSAGQVVVLDTAPVRVANDAIAFLRAVDWVVVVVQAGRSTRRSVEQMTETLRLNGAEIVGVVVVGSAEAGDASRDYYAYYSPDLRDRRDRKRDLAEQTSKAAAAMAAVIS